MRTELAVKEEFKDLKEAEQPSYLTNHGNHLVTNSTTFPAIPHNGAAMLARGLALYTLFSARNASSLAMTNYKTELARCESDIAENYIGVNAVALGDGAIIAMAGLNATSANTSSIGIPNVAEGVKFDFAQGAGEIMVERDVDKLSILSVVITTLTDDAVVVTKNATNQLKVDFGGRFVFIDFSSTIKTTVGGQVRRSDITSVVGLINRNGISPLSDPISIAIPR